MHELAKGKALGIPNKFRFHPFSKHDWKTAAAIKRQAAGRIAMKSTENGRRFFMDYRFIRSSTTDFSKPNSKQDRVVESYDGFLSYLLVIDEASRYAWVFLCEFKEPPTEYASQFLTAFGLKSGGVIQCDQGGELAQSEEFCTEMLKRHGYVVEPTSADSPS